jgi:dTDP-glucose pyrophosphorylase/CBS domain-containing protein
MKWSAKSHPDPRDLCVGLDVTLLEALRAIEQGTEAIAFVCDGEGRVVGSLSDGDVRRALLGGASLDSRCIADAMHRDFTYVTPEIGRAEVLDLMRARDIGQVPVLDEAGRLIGLHTVSAILSETHRDNDVVLLAGGRGTRLHPLTETIPKPMLEVAGRPILERLILHLMGCGLRRFHIAINYLGHVIEDYFGDGGRFGCEIRYLREDRPLGTGGPLSLLSPLPDRPIVAINGDLVTQCNVGRLLDFHDAGGFAATIGIRPYTTHIPFGVMDVDGDRITRIREKPTERMLVSSGIYVLSPDVVRLVPRDQEYPITDLLGRCLEDGLPVGARLVDGDWIDVGQTEDLRRARGEA